MPAAPLRRLLALLCLCLCTTPVRAQPGAGKGAGECLTDAKAQDTCTAGGQDCYDTDTSTPDTWQCRCTGAQYGITTLGRAVCVTLSDEAGWDECAECPTVAGETETDVMYRGVNLINIPIISFAECVSECTRTPKCVAFSYTPPGTETGAGNCVTEEFCCWLKEAGYTTAPLTGVRSGTKSQATPCAACGPHDCVDPTTGTEAVRDWQCRCKAPGYGIATAQEPTKCVQLSAAAVAFDECKECPQIAEMNKVDAFYNGGDIVAIPLLTLEQCAGECTKTPTCSAFSFTPPGIGPIQNGTCVRTENCCRLKDKAVATEVMLMGAMSGTKTPATPCGVPVGFTANVCEARSQLCHDPTAGGTDVLDWLCICNAPDYGVQLTNQVATCSRLTDPMPVDECDECVPRVTAVQDTEYLGADVDTIPRTTLLECLRECALVAGCAAATYTPPGMTKPMGNCVFDTEPCCYLKAVGFTTATSPGVSAGVKNICESGVKGSVACGQLQQDCYDPDTERFALNDWLCICRAPQYGVAVAEPVAPCEDLSSELEVDECEGCPMFATATAPDTVYGGVNIVDIPGLTLDECVRECTYNRPCRAFSYTPSGFAVGNCVDDTKACCHIKGQSGAGSAVMRDAMTTPGATSGVKETDPACVGVGNNICSSSNPRQECVDINTSLASLQDWYCRCAQPRFGVQRVDVVMQCVDPAPPAPIDECRECGLTVEVRDANAVYSGSDLVRMPRVELEECIDQCRWIDNCEAFSFIPGANASASGTSLKPVGGNCLMATESCCLLKTMATTLDTSVGAASGIKARDLNCQTGADVCGSAVQRCVDPDTSQDAVGNWLCQCELPLYGTRTMGVADCAPLSTPPSWDECKACPYETTVTAPGTDFVDANVAAIPFMTLDECREECQNNARCKAFTHLLPGNAVPLGACVLASDSCCYLKGATNYVPFTRADATSGVKATVVACPAGDAGFEPICTAQAQDCVDPTAGSATVGDWQCRCRAPLFGAAVARAVDGAACQQLSSPNSYDECVECAKLVTSTEMNSRLEGPVVASIPLVSLDECVLECNRENSCLGITYTPAGQSPNDGYCVKDAPCCSLVVETFTAVSEEKVTAGIKRQLIPCAVAPDGATCVGREPQECEDPSAGGETTGDWICRCERDPEFSMTGMVATNCPPPPTWVPETAKPAAPPAMGNTSAPGLGAGEDSDDNDGNWVWGLFVGLLVVCCLLIAAFAHRKQHQRKQREADEAAERNALNATGADEELETTSAYTQSQNGYNNNSIPPVQVDGFAGGMGMGMGAYDADGGSFANGGHGNVSDGMVLTSLGTGGRGVSLPPIPPMASHVASQRGRSRLGDGASTRSGSRFGARYAGLS